ncbi:MAG: DUF4910 domain-containing protein [Chloroflexi bacterium]|nr:DUF4910 domain-containing protein [Chloroflexota bacterium]
MSNLRIRLCSLALAAALLVAACTGTPPAPSPVAPTAVPTVGTSASASPAAVEPTRPAPSPTVPPSPTPASQATATSQPAATASPAATKAAVAADLAFSSQRAAAHVQALAGKIGSRPAGSQSIAAARDYIADELAAIGYRVEKQPFTFSQMIDRGTELSVAQPAMKLDPAPLYNTASGEVTAAVVSAGLGRPQDFPADTRGKIALVERGVMIFQEKVDNAAAAGAAAVVIFNNRSGNFRGEVRQRPRIPVVSISQEEGQAIRDLLARGPVRLHLKVDVEAVEQAAHNVVATKPGPADRVVVIGAHYDSVEAGPGANDNGSGTATVIELARATAGRPYPFTLRFMLFDAEELGLLGSRAYVRGLSDADREAIVAMINLDMVGVGDALRFGGSDDLEQLALDLAKEEGVPAGRLGQALRGASDHASFSAVGVPAIFFYRIEDPNYHTADDKPEFVKPEHLAVAGNLVLKLLDRLARP